MVRSERPLMSDYGVPLDPDGALPWEWAQERLLRCRNFWVCTVDPGGRPHATPVWGVWMADEERFWFSCAPSALKARNIAANPHVVVACDDSVEVVSIEGTAQAVSEVPDSVGQAYGVKYEPDPVKQAEMVAFVLSHAVYCVTPIKGIGIIEREDEFATRATRWVW